MDWPLLLDRLKQLLCKIRQSRLSLFGKYRAWSAHGLASILYHAEFVPIPPACRQEIDGLSRTLLGGRNNSWKLSLLSTRPSQGGLGCLPLQEHLQARLYKWIIHLLLAGTTSLWTKLAWNLIGGKRTNAPPLEHLPAHVRALQHPPSLPFDNTPYGLAEVIQQRRMGLVAWLTHAVPPGWLVDGHLVTLHTYTVRAGTSVLTRDAQQQLQSRYHDWIHTIGRTSETPRLSKVLRVLWKVPVHNKWKLPFWEVIADGILTAERLHLDSPCACLESGQRPGRQHHFLSCNAAQALYQELRQITRRQDIAYCIWTASPPNPQFPQPLWALICILVTYALDAGRSFLFKATLGPQLSQEPDLGLRAGLHTRRTFWSLLEYHKATLPADQLSFAFFSP